jgi:hypothetical protein
MLLAPGRAYKIHYLSASMTVRAGPAALVSAKIVSAQNYINNNNNIM